MRTVTYRLVDLQKAIINIGFAGENEYTRILFDCKKVFEEYPSAIPALSVIPPKGDGYPAVATRDGDYVIWDVTDSDLVYEGSGELQLTFTEDEVVVKSFVCRTKISRSIAASGEAPDPVEDWLTEANTALNAIPQTIDDALEAAKESGEFDGFSPVVTITEIAGGHRIQITDADGEHTVDVMDGEDGNDGNGIASITKTGSAGLVDTYTIAFTNGQSATFTVTNGAKGDPGDPGAPGYSPSASVSKNGKTTTFTVTDKSGTTTVEIKDGEDADPTVLINDNAGEGDTDRTWSADKLTSEKSALNESIVQSQTDIANLQKNKAPIIIDTVSGSVASFPDGADGLPVQNLVVNIEPVQSGTGDPSPSNIRPIIGWPGANVYRSDDAVYDKNVDAIQQGSIVGTTGNQTSSNVRIRTTYLGVKPSTTYTINCNLPYCYIHEYSTDNMSGYITNSGGWLSTPCSYTTSATGKCLRFVIAKATSAGGAGSIEVSPSDLEYLTVLENGVSVTIPVSWQTEAGTVYGGNYNVTTGLLTVTHGQIASYNGETLPGEWISDRDVYAEGTTPTTGAQVVYELAEPLTYQLTGTQITTLLGNNCIWADTGDSAVTYRADTKLFCQKNDTVDDVQVNGVSVLSQGVANIPMANSSNPGVAKVSSSYGVTMSNGILAIVAADSGIKAGTNLYYSIVPARQHNAVFYGLAKLAGADMKNVNGETVGVYPEAQKVAIQKMLGIYEPPYELVNDFTLESESSIDLSADLNNIPYNFRDILIRFYYPANTPTASTGYGRYRFYDGNNKYVYCETGKYTTNTAAQFKLIYVTRKGSMTMCSMTARSTTGSTGTWVIKDIAANSVSFEIGNIVQIANVSGDVEPAGTRIQIYAQRAY